MGCREVCLFSMENPQHPNLPCGVLKRQIMVIILSRYLWFYNNERPHKANGGRPPLMVCLTSTFSVS